MKNKKLLSTFLAVALSSTCLFASCGKEKTQDLSVTVSFNANCEMADDTLDSVKCYVGQEYGELPTVDVEKEGYHFVGWNTRADGMGRDITEEDTVYPTSGDHTLYAVWEGNEYNVSFDLNGGNINGITQVSSRKVTYGELYGSVALAANPVKEKANFYGWYLNPEGTGNPVDMYSLVREAKDHTLYAIYRDIRYHYDFTTQEQLEVFSSHGPQLNCEIVNGEDGNYLEVSNKLDKPIGKLFLRMDMKAGTKIEMDVEFIGEANVEENVRAGFFCYGANLDGSSINGGKLGDPNDAATSDEIRKWYWGQGARNDPWEEYIWQNGHLQYTVNILEDCYGLQMMMEFGKREMRDENGEIIRNENGEPVYDSDTSLWQNNKFRINSIRIIPGSEEVQVDFDLNGGNVDGETTMESRDLLTGQTYGALPIVKKEGFDFKGWCLSADGKGEYINSESSVKVPDDHTVYAIFREARNVYDFTTQDQADDFYTLNGTAAYEVVNGEENYLKVVNAKQNGQSYLVYNLLLEAGWTVEFDVEFVGDDSQGRVGVFAYGAQENGNSITSGSLGFPGAPGTSQEITDWYWGKGLDNANAAWNDGKFTITTKILEDCYGVHMWFLYGADAANSYWKITAVRVTRA